GLAVDDEGALLRGERGERHIRGNLFLLCEHAQVCERLAVHFALPAFDRAFVDRERLSRNREPIINVDHATEAATLWARAQRGVERKQGRRRGAKPAASLRRVQST